MLHVLKILPAQPIENAAPEFRVAADVVVRVRPERDAAPIEPHLVGAVAQVLPHSFRVPVLRLLRHEISALEDEDSRRRIRQGLRHRSSAGAGSDDDDVELLIHRAVCSMLA
jgi:hypothetical protein